MRLERPAIAVLLLVAALASTSGAETLTNESIVRMTARGMTPGEIVDSIRAAESSDFDLDPEVVTELRRAGVAEAVIDAMRAAQPSSEPPPPRAESPEPGSLELIFEPNDTAPAIPARDPEGRSVRLAFYLFCTQPTHAPDMWHTRTPFSGGFPRHHLIWTFDTTRPREGRKKIPWIELDLPERVETSLTAGDHRIEAGLAARIGNDDWIPLASAATRLLTAPGEPARIRIRVRTRTGRVPSYSCEIMEVNPAPPT